MRRKKADNNGEIVILLAPGFAEGDAIYCLDRLRRAGLPVALVSVSMGLIRSRRGLSVRPDRLIGEGNGETPPRLLLIPGGRESTALLLTDPRVHRLFAAVRDGGGTIAAMATAAAALSEAGLDAATPPERFLAQREEDVTAFSERLLNRCLG
jgi:putative intracellular protease/amidase